MNNQGMYHYFCVTLYVIIPDAVAAFIVHMNLRWTMMHLGKWSHFSLGADSH